MKPQVVHSERRFAIMAKKVHRTYYTFWYCSEGPRQKNIRWSFRAWH